MDVAVLAKAAIAGLERNTFELRPGMSNALKWMSRVAPDFAAKDAQPRCRQHARDDE